jgi:outer membrane lipase/esterase
LEIIPNANQHLPTQVGNFLADVNGSAPPDALYVVFIGGNDIFDAVYALSFDLSGTTSTMVLEQAITSVAVEINKLAAAGATHFMVLNAPDVGLTPAVKLADAIFSAANPAVSPGDVIAAATLFSMVYNGGLNAVLGSVPGVEIVDIFSVFQDLVFNPQDFGLSNSADACVTPEEPPYVCKKPDSYVFWDGVHPTRVTHSIIADVVTKALAQ